MFKSHLEMIGRNETPSKKAKFWQSYVRSLKGSDDIRAHETPSPRTYRPYSAYVDLPPRLRSIFDEPATPAERISSHGYRYLPVHRETYGYSPRPIYDHHYSRTNPENLDSIHEHDEPQLSSFEPSLSLSCDFDPEIKLKSPSSYRDCSLASAIAYAPEDDDTFDVVKRKRASRKEALEKFLNSLNPIDYGEYTKKTKDYLRTKRDTYFDEMKEHQRNPTGIQPNEYWDFINME